MVCKETPGLVLVFLGEYDPHAATIRSISHIETLVAVVSPDDAHEQGPGACHDRDVGQNPAMIIVRQLFDYTLEEWVSWHRTHGVIADTCRNGFPDKSRILQQRLQGPVAAVVQINVDASVVIKHKVPDGICALNGIVVASKGVEEFGILLRDEGVRHGVCPQHVLPLGLPVEIQTALLRLLPYLRYAGVDVGLMDNFRYDGRRTNLVFRAYRRQFCASDGIFDSVDDEQLQERPDLVHQESQHSQDQDDEDQHRSAHGHETAQLAIVSAWPVRRAGGWTAGGRE